MRHGIHSLVSAVCLILLLEVHSLSRNLARWSGAVATVVTAEALTIKEAAVSRGRGPAEAIVATFSAIRHGAAVAIVVILWEARLHGGCCDELVNDAVTIEQGKRLQAMLVRRFQPTADSVSICRSVVAREGRTVMRERYEPDR